MKDPLLFLRPEQVEPELNIPAGSQVVQRPIVVGEDENVVGEEESPGNEPLLDANAGGAAKTRRKRNIGIFLSN